MLEIGSVIDEKYKILNMIGQGGMSTVYLAMNERANKQWAVKEVRKDGVSNFEIVKQGLVVETDLLKRLNHPNLPSIVDVIDGDGTLLIVMDYIEGNPLSVTLREYGAQSQENVVDWAKQLCDVLEYLHSRRPPIIYRDMKPGNVMLRPDGTVMLIDFGTAREFKSRNVADTTCLGTQGYAAPEQFGGQGQTDARTDIYCLGATMYHLVTGHNPSKPPYELYPIRQWNPELSSGLEQIIMRCTQRNPEDRYQSCAELLYALEHYRELDYEYQRIQKRKMRIFAASFGLLLLSAACMVGFKFAEDNQVKNTYDFYISSARDADFTAAVESYKNATDLDPAGPAAYNGLLDMVMEDGNLSESENEALRLVMNENHGTTKSNVDYFAQKHPAEYAEYSLRMGLSLYYYYEGEGNKSKAQKWFDGAAKSEMLGPEEQKVAEYLCRISEYYVKLASPNTGQSSLQKDIESGDGYTYFDYWTDLSALAEQNLLTQTGREYVAFGVYKEIGILVHLHINELKKNGVPYEEIQEKMNFVQKALDGMITTNNEDLALKQQAKGEVQKANEILKAAFTETGETF